MNMRLRWASAVLGLAPLLLGTSESTTFAANTEDQIGNYRKEGVDVVQGRVFRKGGRHEFGLDLGLVPDNQFLFYEMIQARYTYHFKEALGIEFAGFQVFNQQRNIIGDLANIPCGPNQQLLENGVPSTNCGITLDPPADPWKNIAMASLVWSPIYGKFALFSKKILHFDIYLLAGAGYFFNDIADRFGFNIGAGMKVFLNDWMAARFDIRNITVREGAPFNQIANNRMFSLGLSFFLPTRSKGK